MAKKYVVVVTGAGSVMGQSIIKALSESDFSDHINLIVLNSLEVAAGFNFSDTLGGKFSSFETLICPFATDPEYLGFIQHIVMEHSVNIIYPGTQHELSALSTYKELNDIVACPSSLTAESCLDKATTVDVIRKMDIPAPETVRVTGGTVEREIGFYPCILKPNSSSASRNIFKCDNSKDLETALDKYVELGIKHAVVQDFIEGNEYTCGVYLDKYSGEVSSIILDRELTEDGASLYGVVVEDKTISEYLSSVALAFSKYAGFKYGHINVQLRLAGDKPHLFEINGRLSSTEAPKSQMGFNSVEAYFYNIVLNQPYKKFSPQLGKQFIRYYEEIYF
ncbi:ATP-grasp domain-containing protein [Pontibacterium sp.]|uniref:ATP-grasp domain-containing protein n=1 Tax=Pontibacterium sp. TaxID=2036026 RepID=UPI003512FDB9